MSSPIHPMDPNDLGTRTPGLLDEVIRQAELRLQAQLQSAVASDARAMVLASIEAAASAALVIAGAQTDIGGAIEVACYVSALCLFIGAAAAGWSARPVPFGWPGSNPVDWTPAAQSDESLDVCRAAYATHLDEYLRHNDRFLRRNARWTRIALGSLVAGPFTAAATLLIYAAFKLGGGA